jgi:hypothetical protein
MSEHIESTSPEGTYLLINPENVSEYAFSDRDVDGYVYDSVKNFNPVRSKHYDEVSNLYTTYNRKQVHIIVNGSYHERNVALTDLLLHAEGVNNGNHIRLIYPGQITKYGHKDIDYVQTMIYDQNKDLK